MFGLKDITDLFYFRPMFKATISKTFLKTKNTGKAFGISATAPSSSQKKHFFLEKQKLIWETGIAFHNSSIESKLGFLFNVFANSQIDFGIFECRSGWISQFFPIHEKMVN